MKDRLLAVTVSVDEVREVKVWDLTAGTLRNTLPISGADSVACAQLPDGPVAVVSSPYCRVLPEFVTAWDLTTTHYDRVCTIPNWEFSPGTNIQCTYIDKCPIAVGLTDQVPTTTEQGRLLIWDLLNGAPVPTGLPPLPLVPKRSRFYPLFSRATPYPEALPARPPPLLGLQPGSLYGLVCRRFEGRTVAVTYMRVPRYDGVHQLGVWNLPSGAQLVALDSRQHIGPFTLTQVDGRPVVIFVISDNELRSWDLLSGTITTVGVCEDAILKMACTEIDGRPTAVTTDYHEVLRTWDLYTGARQAIGLGKRNYVTDLVCAELDGQPIAVTVGHDGESGLLQLWDLRRR